jgi:hypothetical protein
MLAMQLANKARLIAAGLLIAAVTLGARGDEQRFTVITPKVGDPFELLEGFSAIEPVGPNGKPLPGWAGSGQMILLDDGRLALAWVSGGIRLSLSFSKDAGVTWDAPRNIDRGLPESTNSARPNLVQCAEGALCLTFYGWERFDAKNPAACVNNLYATRSADGGATWSAPCCIFKGYVGMPQGSCRTSKGRLIVPLCIYTDVRRYSGLCMLSDDGGETWKQGARVEIPDEKQAPTTRPLSVNISRGAIEPTVAERRDGSLLMIIRTIFGAMYECESIDGGETWSTPMRSVLDCGGPGNMVRLPNGQLAIAFNPANYQSPETQRWGSPIGYNTQSLAVLSDDNKTWQITRDFTRQIEGKTRVVHSTITGLADGTMLITLPGRSTLLRSK